MGRAVTPGRGFLPQGPRTVAGANRSRKGALELPDNRHSMCSPIAMGCAVCCKVPGSNFTSSWHEDSILALRADTRWSRTGACLRMKLQLFHRTGQYYSPVNRYNISNCAMVKWLIGRAHRVNPRMIPHDFTRAPTICNGRAN